MDKGVDFENRFLSFFVKSDIGCAQVAARLMGGLGFRLHDVGSIRNQEDH